MNNVAFQNLAAYGVKEVAHDFCNYSLDLRHLHFCGTHLDHLSASQNCVENLILPVFPVFSENILAATFLYSGQYLPHTLTPLLPVPPVIVLIKGSGSLSLLSNADIC